MKRNLGIWFGILCLLQGCAKSSEEEPSSAPITAEASKIEAVEVVTPLENLPLVSVEFWRGLVEIPGGIKVHFGVELSHNEAQGWTGSFVFIQPVKRKVPIDSIKVEGGQRTLSTLPAGAPEHARLTVRFEVDEKGLASKAVFVQGPAELDKVTLTRVVTADEMFAKQNRPQMPKPPFPYDIRDIEYDNPKEEGVHLAGTLTIPKGPGPHPALLLITGSGGQDRDETIMGHKPFWVLADHFTRAGFVVLRVDDRGVGESKGAITSIQSNMTDAQASIAILRQQKEVDPKRVGMVGHSEGGIIAPMIASEDKDIAFIVTLGGTSVPGWKISLHQVVEMVRQQHPDATQAQLEQIRTRQIILTEAVDADKSKEEVIDLMVENFGVMKELGFGEQLAGKSDEDLRKMAEAQATPLFHPWVRSFFKLDPAPFWEKVSCPALVLFGSKDFQVPPEMNRGGIEAAAIKAGNKRVTVHVLKDHNHLFQLAVTGTLQEYEELEETFHAPTLEMIAAWLKEQAF